MNRLNLKSMYRIFTAITLSISVAILSSVCAFAAAEDKIGSYDYQIKNPYETVDWDNWKAYRGATHVHTVRSDGNVELNDMIEKYYELGYEALALTDHGTVNYSWTKDQTRLTIFGYQYFAHGNVDEISDNRYNQITTGSDRDGKGMTEVPLGIELNGSSSSKCHVNSYFADCGHGDLEINAKWPEDAIKKSQNAGGICHINHVGEWTEGKSDIGTYNTEFVDKYSALFMNYSACVGMELVNTSDNRTHNDRYLYDETLKKTAPLGRNVYGFCEDDSHDYEDCGNNAQFFVMPSNTQANIRTSMETGAFFACSKFAKTADELGDGFTATGDFPMVNRINVDENKDQISFTVNNGSLIKIVADGTVIDTKQISSDNETITFDLNNYENQINSYVRFYITGNGGICYAQPFLISKSNYSVSTVKFNLSAPEMSFYITDSDGKIVSPANSEGYYILPQGKYTYFASMEGYESKHDEFIVTKSDIDNATQLVKNITLDKILVFAKPESTTKIDHDRDIIFGLRPGIKDLDDFVDIADASQTNYEKTELGFGTGTIVTVKNNEEAEKKYTIVIFGDVNGDGFYDGQDAFVVGLLSTGMLKKEQVSDFVWMAADCNHDGFVDNSDYELLNMAGLLLSEVEQTEASLSTSAVYSEYLSLISQDDVTAQQPNIGDVSENDTQSESIQSIIANLINNLFNRVISFIHSYLF